VVAAFMDAQIKGDVTQAYSLLSDDDRAAMTLEEWQAVRSSGDEISVAHISYSIDRMQETQDAAEAVLRVEMPDLAGLMASMLGQVLTGDVDVEAALEARVAAGGLPTVTTTLTVNLVRDADGWHVHQNLRAVALMTEALELEENGNRSLALDRLREALAITPDSPELAETIAAMEARTEAEEERLRAEAAMAQYRGNILVEELRVFPAQTAFGESVIGLSGRIRNTGDRTLRQVQIIVYFLDDQGNEIGEKDFNPVLYFEDNLFGGDDAPLRPNYIEDFSYSLADAPTTWGGSLYRVELGTIEFLDEG